MIKDAEYYAEIYCEYVTVSAINEEIALQAPHMLGRLIDFLGEIPHGSGFFHEVISGRIDMMRRVHADFTRAKQLLELLPSMQYKAVIAWAYYIYSQPRESDSRLNTGKDVARFLGVSYECLKKNRQRGLDRINSELGFLIA